MSAPLSLTAPHACAHCGKRFGKATKLERHLLDLHNGELRLSPERPDQSAPSAVSHLLAAAVAESNAVFQGRPAAAPCPRCETPHKPFRNARDLAQHLLAKHTDEDQMRGAVEPVREEHGILPAESEISCKRKRTVMDEETTSPPASPEKKRPRKDVPHLPDPSAAKEKPVKKAKKSKDGKPKSKDKTKSKAKTKDNESKPKRHASAPGRPDPASVSLSAAAPSSGTKPPITPNKPPKPTSAPRPTASPAPPVVPWLASAAVRLPAHAMITTAPMDFYGFAGFAANSRKSYYRLSNR